MTVALAVTAAEKYVAAAYGVVFLAVLVYVLIMALKLVRLEREVGELAERLRERRSVGAEAEQREQVPVA
jgi:CcmD family protein